MCKESQTTNCGVKAMKLVVIEVQLSEEGKLRKDGPRNRLQTLTAEIEGVPVLSSGHVGD